jgi:hypothetical protein
LWVGPLIYGSICNVQVLKTLNLECRKIWITEYFWGKELHQF